MAEDTSYDKGKGKGVEPIPSKPSRIRFTLSSVNLKALENVTKKLVDNAKSEKLQIFGPVRYPNRNLKLTIRRSPCGNGSSTFDRYEMRIHKRVLTLVCPPDFIKKVTSIVIDPGVDVELVIKDA